MSNTQLKIDIPGLNADSGLMLCDGDFKIYLHSLRLYISNMPANLEKMKYVSKETLKDYIISAHGAKSISQYIGAEAAVKTAKELETMAKEGNLDGVLAQNETFIKNAQDLVDSIRSWLVKNNVLNA